MPNYLFSVLSRSMEPSLISFSIIIARQETVQPGDVIAFKAGDIIIIHRLIARLPYPFHNWGLQRGDAHQLGSWIDLRSVIGKVVHPEVSEPISGLGQAAEIACHLAWGAASRAKRLVMLVAGPVMGERELDEETRLDDKSTFGPFAGPSAYRSDDAARAMTRPEIRVQTNLGPCAPAPASTHDYDRTQSAPGL